MKTFKKSLAVLQQKAMEKTNNRENTQESQNLKDLEKRLDDQSFYLRKICKNIRRETNSNAVSIQDGNALADTFIDYCVRLKEDSDLTILSGALNKVGEFQIALEDLRAKLNNSLSNEVSAPLRSMVKTEIKQAKDSKIKYDKVRVSCDASLSDLNNLKKNKNTKPQRITEAEEELEHMKQQFESVSLETNSTMRETADIAEYETVEKMCDYLEAYHVFFQNGFRWLNQMLPDIYEYRLYVENRKSDLEKSKVRQSMMASPLHIPDVPLNPIFGVDLMKLVERDQAPVPKFISTSFEYLKNKALDEEGIFRLSGNKREVMEVKNKLDKSQAVDFYEIGDPNIIANLVKLFLRELTPEPLLTFERYRAFIDTINLEDQDARVKQLATIVDTLPPANHELLRQLLELCTVIAANSKVNKMGAPNLATCLAPNLLIPNYENVIIEDVPIANMVITTLIQQFEKIFPPGKHKNFDWVKGGGGSASGGTIKKRTASSASSHLPVSSPSVHHPLSSPSVHHSASSPSVHHSASSPSVHHPAPSPSVHHSVSSPSVHHPVSSPSPSLSSSAGISSSSLGNSSASPDLGPRALPILTRKDSSLTPVSSPPLAPPLSHTLSSAPSHPPPAQPPSRSPPTPTSSPGGGTPARRPLPAATSAHKITDPQAAISAAILAKSAAKPKEKEVITVIEEED
eukprot:TRINITY_DN3649_c0_g1_i1.p1 TRINITY_DN3649_c0_g1~~TRINITY_DN3649_c0_g1_i1.p1  ORF type:complete len:686 (+),score=179.17 TRINITY_DN3649_c0_g1_i1:75-2132(+)